MTLADLSLGILMAVDSHLVEICGGGYGAVIVFLGIGQQWLGVGVINGVDMGEN